MYKKYAACSLVQKSCVAYSWSLVTNTLEFGNRLTLISHHPLIKVPSAFRRSVESVTTRTNHFQGVKSWHCLQFLAGAVLLSHPVLGAPCLLLYVTTWFDSEYKVNMLIILISWLSKTSSAKTFPALHVSDPEREYYLETNTFSRENCSCSSKSCYIDRHNTKFYISNAWSQELESG